MEIFISRTSLSSHSFPSQMANFDLPDLKESFAKLYDQLPASTVEIINGLFFPTIAVGGISSSTILILLMSDRDRFVRFLLEVGLLQQPGPCAKCGNEMNLQKRDSKDLDSYVWRCNRRLSGLRCNVKQSVRESSWFMGSHYTIRQIMLLTYHLCHRTPRDRICREINVNPGAVTDWTKYMRETMTEYLEDNSEVLGGPGVIVEVDETKFGQGKYCKTRREKSKWVLWGVERGTKKMFLVTLEDRSWKTLTEVIKQWVKAGSTIYTDSWDAFDRLCEEGFRHLTEDHRLNFVDSDTITYGESIGDMLSNVKSSILHYSRDGDLGEALGFYLFERFNKTEKGDIFLSFMDRVRRIDWSLRTLRTVGKRKRSIAEVSLNTKEIDYFEQIIPIIKTEEITPIIKTEEITPINKSEEITPIIKTEEIDPLAT